MFSQQLLTQAKDRMKAAIFFTLLSVIACSAFAARNEKIEKIYDILRQLNDYVDSLEMESLSEAESESVTFLQI